MRLHDHLVADVGRRPPRRPTTCSLRFSPAPRPRVKRPSDRICRVAACWATTAGWYRKGRAGHVGHQRDAAGGLGDRAERHPRVGRVAHLVQPREVVVAAHREVEPDVLGAHHVADQVLRSGLLGHHRVAQLHAHAARLPGASRPTGQPSGAVGSMLMSSGSWKDRMAMPASARSVTSPCSMPASPSAVAARSRSAREATAKLTWSSPVRSGSKPVAPHRSQPEQLSLGGLVDGAAEELRRRVLHAGLVHRAGPVDGDRPAEHLVVERLRAGDVGDGDADVGEAGALDECHVDALPAPSGIRRVRRHSASRILTFPPRAQQGAGVDAPAEPDHEARWPPPSARPTARPPTGPPRPRPAHAPA